MLPSDNVLFKPRLKAQIEAYVCRYFEQVFTFYKFLHNCTTENTKETVSNFKQLNKKFLISFVYN